MRTEWAENALRYAVFGEAGARIRTGDLPLTRRLL
jgi:hypothetical protein